MICINSDQHMNSCAKTKKKLNICDRYEPNRRALIFIFYVRVSVSHKCEAGALQQTLETTADVSFPVRG